MHWKKIPEYPDYAVSATGLIRNDRTKKVRKLCPTNTGYLMFTIKRDKRVYALYPHKLVCVLFNGEPPTDNHIVNHKDGIKTNNHRSNLEWVTHSGNTSHAVMMGLSPTAMSIRVTNMDNNDSFVFNSISEVEGTFHLKRYDIIKLLKEDSKELYEDKYLFEVEREHVRVDGRLGKIAIHDWKTGEQSVVNSMNLATIQTGIDNHLVKRALKKGCLINGIHFRYDDGLPCLKVFTKDEVTKSITDYTADKRWFVKNYLTDEVDIYFTVTEVAEYFGVIPDVIYSHLRRDTATLFRAHHIQQGSAEFPEYSTDRILISQLWETMPTRPVKVISKSTGEEDYHPSIFALGRTLGISNTQMDRLAKANKVPGYDIVFI